jgi:hypothetical protein
MSDQEESNLRGALKALVPTIKAHRYEPITEEETKQWLIAPFLRALGWHPEDPSEVRYEYRANHQCNPVDYYLLVNGKVTLVIEAKRLGVKLDTGLAELFGNLGVAGGVHWCVLTDGDQYRVYRAAGNGSAADKLFFEVSISEDEDTTSKMLSLLARSSMAADPPLIEIEWQGRLLSSHAKMAIEEMLNGNDPALVDSVRRQHPEYAVSTVTAALARLVVEVQDRDPATLNESPPSIPPPDGEVSTASDIKRKRGRGYDVFANLVAQPIKRQDLIAEFVKLGFSAQTATSYISWAKIEIEPLPEKSKDGSELFANVFWFQIEAYKDNAGVVWLRKKPGRDFQDADGDTPFKDWVGR